MRQKNKIIHILAHSPSPNAHRDISDATLPDEDHYIRIDKPPYWLGFFEPDWHVQTARQVQKHSDEFVQECWRPYDVADKVHVREIDGICHRIFPSTKAKREFGDRSPEMVTALGVELGKGNTIIHLSGMYGHLPYLIARKFKNYPIIASHLGGNSWEYHATVAKKPTNRLFYHILSLREHGILRGMNTIFLATRCEYDIISRYHTGAKLFHPIGVDFSLFKGEKGEARKKLGFPEDKIALLYVAPYHAHRGVKNAVAVHHTLKEEGRNVDLYLIGGYKEDPLYDYCQKSGGTVVERLPWEKLRDYLLAGDIFMDLNFDPAAIAGGGFGITAIEALACGTPNVGSHLTHYPGDPEELGSLALNPKEAVKGVKKVLESMERYCDVGERARKQYDWDAIISHIIEAYHGLHEHYYSSSSPMSEPKGEI